MLLTKNLKQFIIISSLTAVSGVMAINLLVLSSNSGAALPARGYVERPGLEMLGVALMTSSIIYVLGRNLYKKDAREIGSNLSIKYHLLASLILFMSVAGGYIICNAFWITDVIWVLGLILISLSLHILYKRNHIKGTHKNKLFL